MIGVSESTKRSSAVLRTVRDTSAGLRRAVGGSSIVRIARERTGDGRQTGSVARNRSAVDSATSRSRDGSANPHHGPEPPSEGDDGASGRPSEPRREGRTDRPPTAIERSATYRLVDRVTRLGRGGLLYRWFTTPPDHDVIVIDLRETRVVGPVLTGIERARREGERGTRSSGLVRLGFRFRNRFRDRPVRVVSFGVIALSIGLLLVLSTTDAAVEPAVPFVLAAMVLALRGTQSTRSMPSVDESRWYRALNAAFSPPNRSLPSREQSPVDGGDDARE